MDPCRMTLAATALAAIISEKLDNDELAEMAALLSRISGTLSTIGAQRLFISKNSSAVKMNEIEVLLE